MVPALATLVQSGGTGLGTLRQEGASSAEAGGVGNALRALDWLVDGGERRIFCIANSDEVPVEAVCDALNEGDIVVFYNACRHAAALAGRDATALCFFHAADWPGVIHGLDAARRPLADLSGFSTLSRACVLHPEGGDGAAGGPDGGNGESPVKVTGFPTFEVETARLAELFGKRDPTVIPSAGYASVLLIELVNFQRVLAGRVPHRLVLCGFTGRYDGTGYMGHDFPAEQAAYARLPNVDFMGTPPRPEASRLHHELADVFHSGYDGFARPKPGLLFDVARLRFAAGDVPGFVDLVRQSLAVNPGFGETQWLLRALAILRERGEPARELEALSADLPSVTARWKAGFDTGGLGGARYPAEVDHPQAQYAIPNGGRPAVLVLNETSKMGFNRWHLGCDLVSRNLAGALAARGIEVAGWANGIAGLSRILAHDPAARFSGVVLNGEGTLHDDADRAFELLGMARHLRGLGKRAFLINSVWQAMGPTMADFLKDFDIVTLRKSASAHAAAPARPDARTVPDLCWLAELDAGIDPGNGMGAALAPCGVLDCVTPATTLRLEAAAAAAAAPCFVMDRFFQAFHRALASGAPAAVVPRVLRQHDVRSVAAWIGGRFHGTVLALGAGVPILSLPSNTTKTEATLGDIGLSGKVLGVDALDGVRNPADLSGLFSGARDFSGADWKKVDDYRTLARREIDATFDDIAAALA